MTGLRRGACPSLYEPMASGDGLLVRVKPPLGRLGVEAARNLAAAARRWGNGQIDLTNRGVLQVRGLSEAVLPAFRAAVLAADLASPDPAIERRRNLILSPFASPAGAAFAAELERWIARDEALAALPPKFGFAVETPGLDPQPPPGDIRLALGAACWRVILAGGEVTGLTADPLAAVQTITHRFLRLAAERDEPPRRMEDLVRRCGHEAIFAGAGVVATVTPIEPAAASPAVAGRLGCGFALGLAFGAMTAEDLERAATLAERFANGVLRLSPWRALVLADVGEAALTELAQAADVAGFVVRPSDPRLSVVACAGAPACASAHAPTRTEAAIVAARRPQGLVHLSGCAKGCAHPAAAITLVAAPDGYGLVPHGRTSDAPEQTGLSLEQALRLLSAEIP